MSKYNSNNSTNCEINDLIAKKEAIYRGNSSGSLPWPGNIPAREPDPWAILPHTTTTAGGRCKPWRDPLPPYYTSPIGPCGSEGPPLLTDLQQCIKDCLRLATFCGSRALLETQNELARLQARIEAEVKKELDAWKNLMGADAGPAGINAKTEDTKS